MLLTSGVAEDSRTASRTVGAAVAPAWAVAVGPAAPDPLRADTLPADMLPAGPLPAAGPPGVAALPTAPSGAGAVACVVAGRFAQPTTMRASTSPGIVSDLLDRKS